MAIMSAGRRILIADDSEKMTNLISKILKDANYRQIDCVHDAGSALWLLRQREFDLIITDAQMEPISGSVLTKLIREGGYSKARIIIIGLFSRQDKASLDRADGYLTKPFEPQELIQKVQDVLAPTAFLASG
jgi:two-component system chemotaxis response regulator CheY